MIGQSLNKENQIEIFQTLTSEDSEYPINPFMKIQIIDSEKFSASQNQTYQQLRPEIGKQKLQQKEIVESLERRFKLEIKKEMQFFNIVETKLKQQIEFLSQQNLILIQQNKDLKKKLKQRVLTQELQSETSEQNSSLVVNQIKNLKNMLSSLQKQHENCISNKKELMDAKQTLQMKIIILEKQCKQLESQYKDFRRKLETCTQFQSQNVSLKKQNQSLRKEVISMRVLNQQQEKQFSKQLSVLQKAIQEIRSKTFVPEIDEKLILYANEQPYQPAEKHHFKNTLNFVQSSANLEASTDRNMILSQTKRFSTNSFQKSSFEQSSIGFSMKKSQVEKEIIHGLYKKNLTFLNQKQQTERINQLDPNFERNNLQNTKPQETFRMLATKNQNSQNRFSCSTRREVTISSKLGSKTRRFHYL